MGMACRGLRFGLQEKDGKIRSNVESRVVFYWLTWRLRIVHGRKELDSSFDALPLFRLMEAIRQQRGT